jgi:predicted ATPase
MINRIRLRGYKSFVDADLRAGPLTVIFGPNDAGKSNLLDAFSLLSELAEVDSLKKAFDPALHRGRLLEAFHSLRGFGEKGLRSLQARQEIAFEIEVDLLLQPQIVDRLNATLAERERLAEAKATYTRVAERSLRYRLRLRYDYRSGEPFVSDEHLVALSSKGERREGRKPFIEREPGASRFVVRIERQGHPRYYDVNRNRTLLSEISDPVYHPHVVAAKEELRSWRSYYVEPSLVRREVGVHGADDPGRHGEELAAFYWKLKHEHPEAFRTVGLNLQGLVPSLEGLEVREVLGSLDAMVIERGGGEFPFRLASEGTLRLLCLLGIAIAPNPPSMVAYEEPENGVQPARLDILADVIRGVAESGRTQVILTTHSPTFLERIRGARFVACRRDLAGGSLFIPYGSGDQAFAADDLDAHTPLSERVVRGDY